MSEYSRRNFLAVAGLGTAAGVAAAAAPAAGAEEVAMPREAEGGMAVYVDDVRTGRLTIMVEGAERTVVDRRLAARIARAYHRAQ